MISSVVSKRERDAASQGSGWKFHLSMLAIAGVALVILYRDTFGSMIYMWWTEGTYSHGLLIFPISLYLIWEKRQKLSQLQPQFSFWLVPIVLLTSLLWLAGHMVHARVVEHFAVISFIVMLVWIFLGKNALREIIFPVLFLYLAIPIWDPFLTPVLQYGTAHIVYYVLSSMGVPILLDGHFLTIPEGAFEVARSCAGTRYFISGFTLSLLYAYLMYRSFRKRLVFVISTVALCLVINVVRVVLVIMAGHLTNMQHPWVEDHVAMGWVVFALFIIPFFWFGMRYQDTDIDEMPPSNSAYEHDVPHAGKAMVTLSMTLILLGSGPVLASYLNGKAEAVLSTLSERHPSAKASWQGPRAYEGIWRPTFVGANLEQMVSYFFNGKKLDYYVAQYAIQTQGNELVDLDNRVYDREEWFQQPGGETHLYKIDDLWPYQVQETVIQSSKYGTKVVWQWYSVAGHETASPKKAKMLELAKLFEDQKISAAIVLAVDEGDIENARQLMRRFLMDMGKEIESSLLSESN